ncbi:MAG: hypothetical protein PHI13_16525, partial [Methylococcales bacterium]|nr:hypothetical protein [Methylococcales bacterium]
HWLSTTRSKRNRVCNPVPIMTNHLPGFLDNWVIASPAAWSNERSILLVPSPLAKKVALAPSLRFT